jgi:hypothetical protein
MAYKVFLFGALGLSVYSGWTGSWAVLAYIAVTVVTISIISLALMVQTLCAMHHDQTMMMWELYNEEDDEVEIDHPDYPIEMG